MTTDNTETVERYLRHVAGHDWAGLAECLTEDVVRVGPFGDTYTPRDPYVEFLSQLMPNLEEYEMRVDRITANQQGDVITVELTESMRIGDRMIATPEALVFDMSDDGRIAHISIYIQRLSDG